MTTVKKEKNIIAITLDGKAKPYTFDINTGLVNGMRGLPIKSVPKPVMRALTNGWNYKTQLQALIYGITYGYATEIGKLQRYVKQLQMADSLDNLGIKTGAGAGAMIDAMSSLVNDKKLCKDFIKYAQECELKGEDYSLHNFKYDLEKKKAIEKFGFDINDEKYNDIYHHLLDLSRWATPRQIKSFCVNFIDNDYYQYYQGYGNAWFYCQFKDYCNWCEYLNEKVTTKENFIHEYARMRKAYVRQKEEIDAKRFAEAMNIHKAEMEFEYGDFKVVIPTTPQDIKDEGKNMHHCVAGYAYECMNTTNARRSHIVFVRHKDTPNKCYITCEIRNGKIGQYYLSHDRRITNQADIDFKLAYQQHLDQNWTKE